MFGFDFFLQLAGPVLLLAAAGLLIVLTIIDLRHFLLPNIYVFPLGMAGTLYHATTGFALLPPESIALGALVGGGLLYAVRYFGTLYYKQEAMGLGDIKLMLAGGLWLGPEHIITAILLGAFAGLVHGLFVAVVIALKNKAPFSIRRLVIPAGPGFIVGLVLVFTLEFGPFAVQKTMEIFG